jgi:hypothetical protein
MATADATAVRVFLISGTHTLDHHDGMKTFQAFII